MIEASTQISSFLLNYRFEKNVSRIRERKKGFNLLMAGSQYLPGSEILRGGLLKFKGVENMVILMPL